MVPPNTRPRILHPHIRQHPFRARLAPRSQLDSSLAMNGLDRHHPPEDGPREADLLGWVDVGWVECEFGAGGYLCEEVEGAGSAQPVLVAFIGVL